MEAAILILTRISVFLAVKMTDLICQKFAVELSSSLRTGHLLPVV